MAAEIAREIIAQSKGGSKLAFSFFYNNRDCNLLIFSSTCENNERAVYYVHTTKDDKVYEFRCNDASSAATLAVALLGKKIRSLNPHLSFSDCWDKATMKLVFCQNGVRVGVVGVDFLTYNFPASDPTLGFVGTTSRCEFLQEKLMFLDKVGVVKK